MKNERGRKYPSTLADEIRGMVGQWIPGLCQLPAALVWSIVPSGPGCFIPGAGVMVLKP